MTQYILNILIVVRVYRQKMLGRPFAASMLLRISSLSSRQLAATRFFPAFYSSQGDAGSSLPQTTSTTNSLTSKDGVVAQTQIDFDLAAKIEGNESQILTVQLEPGQVLRAESGAMMYMTEGVTMNTTTGGGLSAGFQRMLTGQNFFISDYTYEGNEKGTVALGTDFPSKIQRLNVNEYGGKIVCQKGALLCASHAVDVSMEFTKSFSAGFFGGEGFVLQALTGEGDVFVKAGGTLIRRDLREGENLRIASGALVAMSKYVSYDVQQIKGFGNIFAGGEGLFMTTLSGPGVVWLQGQPVQRMISEIVRRVPTGGPGVVIPMGVPGSGGGSANEGENQS